MWRRIKAPGAELSAGLSEFRHKVHATIKKVTDDIEDSFHFNTAIAAVMELVNAFYLAAEKCPGRRPRSRSSGRRWRPSCSWSAPWCPTSPRNCGRPWGTTTLCLDVPWPQAQAEALDGLDPDGGDPGQRQGAKPPGQVPASTSDEEIKNLALADPAIDKWLQGQPPKKVILARRKLVSIVV